MLSRSCATLGRAILNNQRHLISRSMVNQETVNMTNPVESSIRNKLSQHFNPNHLEIINESYMHNVPKGSETHFKVVVVSSKFENSSLLQRHRLVNETLQDELKSGVHALSIVAKTPLQWEESSKTVEKSPACKGGFGK